MWQAFDAEGGIFGDLFKLLLLTGQRRRVLEAWANYLKGIVAPEKGRRAVKLRG